MAGPKRKETAGGDARSAGAAAYAGTGGFDQGVRDRGEGAYASTGGSDRIARNAGEGAYASTGGSDRDARTAEYKFFRLYYAKVMQISGDFSCNKTGFVQDRV